MTVENTDSTMGALLREAREAKGLPLVAVEAETKISVRMLRGLESGKVEALPPPIYARSLVRRYAQFLSLDPDQIASLLPSQPEPPSLPPAPHVERRISHRVINVLTGVAFVGAIVVIGSWVYDRTYVERPAPAPIAMPFQTPSDAAEQTAVAAAAIDRPDVSFPSRARSAPAGPRNEETAIVESSAVERSSTASAIRPMTILVRAVEPTSVSVRVDDAEVFAGALAYGDTKEFTGQHEITVHSPNAGGVEIIRNGQTVGLLGRPSEVSERTWSAAP